MPPLPRPRQTCDAEDARQLPGGRNKFHSSDLTTRSEDRPKKLQFLHIPKTGGTTLRSILLRHFAPCEVQHFYRLEFHKESIPLARQMYRFDPRTEHEHRRVQIIVGHTGYGLHNFWPVWSEYITILREPVARALSHYHFARRHVDNRFHVEAKEMGIIDFFESGIYRHLDNGQTRFLSGTELEQLLHGRDVPFGHCTPGMLEQAKANLRESFRVVCLLERFDESLMLLRRSLGCNKLFYSRLNVGRSIPLQNVAPDVRRCVESHNQLDAELYAYASTLFAEQYRAGGVGLSTQVQAFKTLNVLHQAGARWLDVAGKTAGKAGRKTRRYSDRVAHRLGLGARAE